MKLASFDVENTVINPRRSSHLLLIIIIARIDGDGGTGVGISYLDTPESLSISPL